MRVLQIVHGYPPFGQRGRRVVRRVGGDPASCQGGDVVAVLAREGVDDAPEFRVRQESRDGLTLFWINNTFRTTRSFEDTYVNAQITARASQVIDAARPDVAHIHHLTCLSTTIVDALARRGIPVVLTLHDYWLICHRGQLLDRHMQRCDGPGTEGLRHSARASRARRRPTHTPAAYLLNRLGKAICLSGNRAPARGVV